MADLEKGLNPPELVFQAPTTNEDGSPIVGDLSYMLYRADDEASLVRDPANQYLTLPANLNQRADGAYVLQFPHFAPGRHVIALTAIDIDGDESRLSNTMGFERSSPGVQPSPPVFLDA